MTNERWASRRTPIDAAYPSCEDTRAKLLVYVEDGDVSAVTEALGLEPSSHQVKRAPHTNSLGRTRVARSSFWCLSSEGKVASKDLRHHLDWLLEHLGPKRLGLRRLQARPGIKMGIDCVWWSRSGHGGPTLWPEQMARLADLNLECSFDIYFAGDWLDE